jgi:hypothetical protein
MDNPRLGTAGRPGTERLMRLPCRMCPLGKGIVAWLYMGGLTRLEPEAQTAGRLCRLLRSKQRDVDLIANWPTQSADNRLEIRRVLEALPFGMCGRSPVVFTEGSDLGPTDRGSDSEACEIGGLGTLCLLGLQPDFPSGRTERGLCGWEGRL